MTLWLGQDGFDYAFQGDYAQVWDWEIDGIREVAEHDPDCLISIEYKPNEPRAYSLLPRCGDHAAGHRRGRRRRTSASPSTSPMSLYADEQPAFAAALIAAPQPAAGRASERRLCQARRRADGRRGASQATLELLRQIRRDGYDGAIYFDTFPDASGPRPGGRMRGQHRHRPAPAGASPTGSTATTASARRIGRQDAVASQSNRQRGADRQR